MSMANKTMGTSTNSENLASRSPEASKSVPAITPSNVMNDLSVALANANISSPSSSQGRFPGNSEPRGDEPLQTFHPFPRLPTELRIQIWTLALRPAKRLYTVSVSIPPSPTSNLSLQFKIYHPAPAPTPTSTSNHLAHATALLLTSHESRAIYLSQHTSFLPTSPTTTSTSSPTRGKLHFSPSHTTFHINNYTTLQRSTAFASNYKSSDENANRLKHMLEGVRHLATSKDSFYPSVERDAWWGGRGGGQSIRIFPNLETWYCVLGDSGSKAAAEEEMRRARERLESFRTRFDDGWRVPRVEMLEL